jgi:hypothetical protein
MVKRRQVEKVPLINAYSLFVFAIRTQITRDYYLRRLRSFFDFINLLPTANMEKRCNHFASLASKDHDWIVCKIITFLQYQKSRVERQEITAATLSNFVKSLKLFLEVCEIQITWKSITLGFIKFIPLN